MTKTSMVAVAGRTTTTFCDRYEAQVSPVRLGTVCCATAGVNGFPQAQRTRGTPRSSTRTAVPVWSTAW
jgi:hypothetical protein